MLFNATVTLGEMLVLFIIFTALARYFFKVLQIYRVRKLLGALSKSEQKGIVSVERLERLPTPEELDAMLIERANQKKEKK